MDCLLCGRTVEVQELLIGGLGGELLGVGDGGVEGRHVGWCWVVLKHERLMAMLCKGV